MTYDENFFENDVIKGYDGKVIIDKYNLFSGVNERASKNSLIYDLYYELGYLSLNYLWSGISSNRNYFLEERDYSEEEIYKESLKELELTLKYIYPVLKEGKLKVRLKEFEFEKEVDSVKYFKIIESIEYKKDEVEIVIDEIMKRWKKLKTIKERRDFTMDNVQFTLPENKWRD